MCRLLVLVCLELILWLLHGRLVQHLCHRAQAPMALMLLQTLLCVWRCDCVMALIGRATSMRDVGSGIVLLLAEQGLRVWFWLRKVYAVKGMSCRQLNDPR